MRTVDEVVRHGVVHGVLVDDRLSHDEVIGSEYKLIECLVDIILNFLQDRAVIFLRLVKKTLNGLLGDGTLLFVEQAFEDHRRDVEFGMKYSGHRLKEFSTLSVFQAVELERMICRNGATCPHVLEGCGGQLSNTRSITPAEQRSVRLSKISRLHKLAGYWLEKRPFSAAAN